MQYKEQLCFNCSKACGGCSWSRSFKPVEGWKAKFRKSSSCKDSTYAIEECPEFEYDGVCLRCINFDKEIYQEIKSMDYKDFCKSYCKFGSAEMCSNYKNKYKEKL